MRPPAGRSLERPGLVFRARARLRRSAAARALYRRRHARRADAFLISFPKAGRTWLRLLLGKAIAGHFALGQPDLLALHRLAGLAPGIPRIRCTHDEDPHWKCPQELVTRKTEYRDHKVVLLARDPRDLVVSAWFQASRRERVFQGDLASFVRCQRGSLATLLRFYALWAENRCVPSGFLLVRYEDLHADPAGQLRSVADFVGLDQVSDRAIEAAVAFASFERMHEMELRGELGSRLRPADPADPESFKTRRGRVGGYVDYLGRADIRWIEQRMAAELPDLYGYRSAPP